MLVNEAFLFLFLLASLALVGTTWFLLFFWPRDSVLCSCKNKTLHEGFALCTFRILKHDGLHGLLFPFGSLTQGIGMERDAEMTPILREHGGVVLFLFGRSTGLAPRVFFSFSRKSVGVLTFLQRFSVRAKDSNYLFAIMSRRQPRIQTGGGISRRRSWSPFYVLFLCAPF